MHWILSTASCLPPMLATKSLATSTTSTAHQKTAPTPALSRATVATQKTLTLQGYGRTSQRDFPSEQSPGSSSSTESVPSPKVTKSGQFEMMVQLAAFRKEDKAKTAAALLNQKHANRLRGHQLDVRSIKSTDGQVFWRVITDPIPKQDALSICDGLKRAGQDCIIRQTKAQKP